jgi:hypothetical protein
MAGEALFGEGIIARFAFVTLIIIGFYVFLRIGLVILGLIYMEESSPHLFDGMVKTSTYRLIKQDPTETGSIPVMRSDNESKGGEFTWSVWLYMDEAQSVSAIPYHIFNKGSKEPALTSDNYNYHYCASNGPGLYLTVTENSDNKTDDHKLQVLMDTFGGGTGGVAGRATGDTGMIEIDNIPLKKWVNIIIRAENKTVDVFINGVLARRTIFAGVVRQNYGDVHVATELGDLDSSSTTKGISNGFLSNLWYYDKSIGTMEILRIVNNGPNTTFLGDDNIKAVPSYLSTSWYTSSMIS